MHTLEGIVNKERYLKKEKKKEKKTREKHNKGTKEIKKKKKQVESSRKTILLSIGQLRVERRDKSREETGRRHESLLSKSKEQTPLITSSTARSPTVHVHAQ